MCSLWLPRDGSNGRGVLCISGNSAAAETIATQHPCQGVSDGFTPSPWHPGLCARAVLVVAQRARWGQACSCCVTSTRSKGRARPAQPWQLHFWVRHRRDACGRRFPHPKGHSKRNQCLPSSRPDPLGARGAANPSPQRLQINFLTEIRSNN